MKLERELAMLELDYQQTLQAGAAVALAAPNGNVHTVSLRSPALTPVLPAPSRPCLQGRMITPRMHLAYAFSNFVRTRIHLHTRHTNMATSACTLLTLAHTSTHPTCAFVQYAYTRTNTHTQTHTHTNRHTHTHTHTHTHPHTHTHTHTPLTLAYTWLTTSYSSPTPSICMRTLWTRRTATATVVRCLRATGG